jgi:hypothetical protein
MVVLEGRKMIYLRGMDFSAQQIQEDHQQPAEQIMTTLRAFAATSRRTEVSRLVITGAGLSAEQCAALERKLGLSVSSCEPGADLIPPDESARGGVNPWTALIGSTLSYRRRAHAGFNFRRGEFKCHGAVAGVKKHAAFSGALVAVLILAGVGHLRSQANVREAERDAIEARMVELFRNAFGREPVAWDKVLEDMLSKDGPVQKGKDEYKIYSPYIAGTVSTLDVLNDVIKIIPDVPGLVVEELTVTKATVSVSGEVTGAGNVEVIRQQLGSSGLLQDVIVDREVSKRNTNNIEFAISGTRT